MLQVSTLEGGEPVVLTGPGIRDQAVIAPRGLPPGFWTQVQANHERFQFGVDLVLVAGSRLLALPRSTHVELKGG